MLDLDDATAGQSDAVPSDPASPASEGGSTDGLLPSLSPWPARALQTSRAHASRLTDPGAPWPLEYNPAHSKTRLSGVR